MVTKDEMVRIYDRTFVKAVLPKKIYEKIRLSSNNQICPFCGQQRVKTVDHILPKRKYPQYAITPINLVPACADCNKTKGDTALGAPEEVWLHPYFDDVNRERWLFSGIHHGAPPGISFFIVPPSHWSDIEKARLRNHFDKLELGSMYASYAGEVLSENGKRFKDLFEIGGSAALREDLETQCVSCFAENQNSWKGAMFEALSQDDWFCDGGFIA